MKTLARIMSYSAQTHPQHDKGEIKQWGYVNGDIVSRSKLARRRGLAGHGYFHRTPKKVAGRVTVGPWGSLERLAMSCEQGCPVLSRQKGM